MQRIAVIGCSHSNHHSCEDIWAIQIARNHNVHIDNYATSGHGVIYFDFVLKYIIANKIEYDCIIIQHTGINRWTLPLEGFTTHRKMVSRPVLSNYNSMAYDIARANLSMPVMFQTAKKMEEVSSMYNDLGTVVKDKHKNYQVNDAGTFTNFASEYFNLFVNTLSLYEKIFKNIFHFSFSNNNAGNIGLPNFESWLAANYGDVMKYYDETRHLTSEGNTILYSEYIMNSPIGDYLRGIE
jgi:hypothetical protein